MAIYDCFQYFNEDHIVDIRLNILDKYVDYFVISESNMTHQGHKKKLNFDINNFPKFKDKIKYIVIDKEPEGIVEENNNPTLQRANSLKRVELSYNEHFNAIKDADDNDFVMLSDNDEIPNLDSEDFKKNKNDIVIFNQLFFYFKFNLLYNKMLWPGTKGCRKKKLISFSWLRNIKFKKYPIWRIDTYFSKTKYSNLNIIKNGGWHFTNLKSPEDMFEKFMNFGHHDEFRLSGITIDKIKDKISKREMFYDHFADKSSTNKWESDYKLQNIDLNLLPEYLINNKNKYSEWFSD